MVQIGIADISKTPMIIENLHDVAQIINKKTKTIKGFFIPFEYKNIIQDAIEQIEYQKFLERNKSLITNKSDEDKTLMDGLDENY